MIIYNMNFYHQKDLKDDRKKSQFLQFYLFQSMGLLEKKSLKITGLR